ncbi:hypothetical protein D3C87_1924850 [compost metagenome]
MVAAYTVSLAKEAASEPSESIKETIIETSITVIEIAKIMVPYGSPTRSAMISE